MATEETKATPRVVRRGSNASAIVKEADASAEFFSDTLPNGRLVTFRELTASDLLFLEKSLPNAGDMERSLKLAARISVGEGRVTYEDLSKLNMKDLKVITALLAKAGDSEEDDDVDEFPND